LIERRLRRRVGAIGLIADEIGKADRCGCAEREQGCDAHLDHGTSGAHSPLGDQSRLVPVFPNRDAFIRAAGLSSADHAWVLVIGRDGQVLARVEGEYSHEKGQALRETLLAQSNFASF